MLHGSQPAAERHLRRMLRRAHEAAWVRRQGRLLSLGLQKKVIADAIRAGARHFADEGAWGASAKRLAGELKGLLDAQRKKSLQDWQQ
eukprot:14174291-Alexandrium_andersonii.AAC.1